MTKTIRKKEYNTETSTLIQEYSHGTYGDPAGYAENLHQTPEGLFFLHVCGGAESPYPVEDILALAKTKVAEWKKTH